ncbi:MAG: hypothetical protein D3910_14695, partial [Candidatus Electrothrix sp. ATG2]|nr:hypothetical protein [Candidatus Electrothrix sp. ATG2]
PYINLLITNQRIDEAALIWKTYYPSDSLLYNGFFSLPLVQGGFGWQFWRRGQLDAGVIVEVQNQDKENTALHLHFKGEQNINLYHVYQIVPLSSGQRFTLTGKMRSKALNTDQRPFLEVMGRPSAGNKCYMLHGAEMVGENQDWTPFTLSFTVPDECNQGVMLRLRRLPSKKIDSLISGDLWLTNLSIQKESLRPF